MKRLSLVMKRLSFRSLLSLGACALAVLGANAPARAQYLLAQPNIPVGITTDKSGNVYVDTDRTWDHGISVYAPNGSPRGYILLGGFSAIGSNTLATYANGNILIVNVNGKVSTLNPANGAVTSLFDLTKLNADISGIYDIATGRISNLGGLILPQYATFGDVAILERPGVTDLFISGLSQAGTYPFVMRVRMAANKPVVAKVVAASVASTSGSSNGTRGVAVNSQGLVVTTLPLQTSVGAYDRLVSFSADFPETRQGLPAIKLNGKDMASHGMASDAKGNFYIATGSVGTSLAGTGGSGALIKVSADASTVLGIGSLHTAYANSQDVAISPAGDRIYMTILTGNAVVFWTQ